MSNFTTKLQSKLQQTELKLTNEQLVQLEKHFELMNEFNSKVNLTSIRDLSEIIEFHYLESLLAAPFLEEVSSINTWVDIGTGAGFPGVPLATMFHVKHFILSESKVKKATFLEEFRLNTSTETNIHVFPHRISHKSSQITWTQEPWGLLARALEKFEKQIPSLLKIPNLKRAVFWINHATALNTINLVNSKWTKYLHKLPTGNNRFLLVLTSNPEGIEFSKGK